MTVLWNVSTSNIDCTCLPHSVTSIGKMSMGKLRASKKKKKSLSLINKKNSLVLWSKDLENFLRIREYYKYEDATGKEKMPAATLTPLKYSGLEEALLLEHREMRITHRPTQKLNTNGWPWECR